MAAGVLPPDPFDTAISYRKRLAASWGISPSTIAITEPGVPISGIPIRKQQLTPLLLLLSSPLGPRELIALIASTFRIGAEEATLLFLSQKSDAEVEALLPTIEPDAIRRGSLAARVNNIRNDLYISATENLREVQVLHVEWQKIRQVPPARLTQENYLGENRSLTPTFLGTDIAPKPEDLLAILDKAEATYEVPLIVGQVPGKPPIVKFNELRPFRRDAMKTKQLRAETIYGVIIFSQTVEKKLTMRFFYNLRTGNFTYHFDRQAAGDRPVLLYLARAFPNLNLEGRPAEIRRTRNEEEEDEQLVYGVQYSFLIYGILLERITLYELCRRWPTFYRYLAMNENRHSMPRAKNPFIYFHFRDDEIPEIRIKANQVEASANNLQVEVKATVSDSQYIEPFKEIFSYLMGWLQATQASILGLYRQILNYPELRPQVDVKEAHFQKRPLTDLSHHALLKSTLYPTVFPQNYDFLVPADRQPIVEGPATELTSAALRPGEYVIGGYRLRCQPAFPRLRMKGNLPICYPEHDIQPLIGPSPGDVARLLTPRASSGNLSIIRTPVRDFLNASRVRQSRPAVAERGNPIEDVAPGTYGVVALNIRMRLATIYPEYADAGFNRLGTPKIANSLLFAVLTCVEDDVLGSLLPEYYPPYLAWVRRQLLTVHPECCRQQLWKESNAQIQEQLADLDLALDSRVHYRAVEELFQVNLLILVQSPAAKEDYDLEVPLHYGPLLVQPRVDRPTIVLLRRDLESTYASANPHYEPIVHYGASSGVLKVYGEPLSRTLPELYRTWCQNWLYDGATVLTDALPDRTFEEVFSALGTGVLPSQQILDSYGKQRGVVLVYSNGLTLTVFGQPRAPANLPEVKRDVPVIDWSTLSRIISTPPVARSTYQGKTVGLWYVMIGRHPGFYIPIEPEEVVASTLPELPSPYLPYHVRNFSDPIEARLDARRLQIQLLSILQWLGTLALKEGSPNFASWFVLRPGEYDLRGLPILLPIVRGTGEAMAYLAEKTSGLVAEGRLRVGNEKLARVFRTFLERLRSAGQPALLEVPLYLTGFYRNYRELATDRGQLAVNDWQLRMRLGPTIDNPLHERIPLRIVNAKIEDSDILVQPIFYLTPDKRPVMLVNMRMLQQETDQVVLLQEALRAAFDHYIQKLARNRGLSQEQAEAQAELDLPVEPDFQGIKRRPYVHYYVSFDGILQLSSRDDHSGGKIPYLEVAQLKLSDDSVYILAVLPLT